MLIYVRHGATALNTDEKERLRGWLPLPLSPEGRAQAATVADRLPKVSQVAGFLTSDLPRALETAQILGKRLGMQAQPDQSLRDWNTGLLAGQKVEDVLPLMHALIDSPQTPAPKGEPLAAFFARFVPLVKEAVSRPEAYLMVGHARGATVLEGLAHPKGGKGDRINQELLYDRPKVQPGGVMTIQPDWSYAVTNPSSTMGETKPSPMVGISLGQLTQLAGA